MDNISELQNLAREIVRSGLQTLETLLLQPADYHFEQDLPREMKAGVDKILDQQIIDRLMPTKLPILTEESGEIPSESYSGLHWIVDPLDGTVNYIRRIGPCAISIALYQGDSPVFGVIGEFPSKKIAWGSLEMGAFRGDLPLHVSNIRKKSEAVLCSGFPSRFRFDADAVQSYFDTLGRYAKVRMLGAASLSLLHVADGSADAYLEEEIMWWDVAAGLAIVQSAGGCFQICPGSYPYSLKVFASNGHLKPERNCSL